MKFSLILPYHDNPNMLRVHYAYLMYLTASTGGRDVELIVCDDASSEPMPEPPPTLLVRVRQFRIDPPHIPWSHRCATNVAASYATGERLILTDIDHVLEPDAWAAMFAIKDNAWPTVGTFTRRNLDKSEYKPHPDSWVMRREMWDLVGGYDTRYRGSYGQNWPFIDRVAAYAEPKQIPVPLTRVSREDLPDASERVLERKSDEARARIGNMMQTFKRDGSFLSKQPLVEHRQVWPTPGEARL